MSKPQSKSGVALVSRRCGSHCRARRRARFSDEIYGSVAVLWKARDLRPDDYKIRRKCAGRYLSTFDLDKAESAFTWCVDNTSDRLDALYMLACCKYYQGEYEKAKVMFDECIDLAKDNGDMYVAALFWTVACSVQTGQDVAGDMAKFSENIPIGHHTGYMQSLKLFAGKNLPSATQSPKKTSCSFAFSHTARTYTTCTSKTHCLRTHFWQVRSISTPILPHLRISAHIRSI